MSALTGEIHRPDPTHSEAAELNAATQRVETENKPAAPAMHRAGSTGCGGLLPQHQPHARRH